MNGLIISIVAATTIILSTTKGNYLLVELESAEGHEGSLYKMKASPRSLGLHFEKGAAGTTSTVPSIETTSLMNDNKKSEESHEETTTIRNLKCKNNIKILKENILIFPIDYYACGINSFVWKFYSFPHFSFRYEGFWNSSVEERNRDNENQDRDVGK